MRRNLQSFGLMVLMSIMLLLPQVAFADTAPSFSLGLNASQVTLGNEIQVTVTGRNITDLYAYELNLDFDNAMMEFKGISSGVSGGFSVDPQVNGNHLQFAFTKVSKVPGENGTVNLATATFKTILQGSAELQLKSVKLVDSKLNDYPYNADAKVTVSIVSSSNGNPPPQTQTSTPNTPKDDQVSKGTIVMQPGDGNLDAATKTATFVLSNANWDKAIQQTAANEKGIKKINIEMKEIPGAEAYKLQVPANLLSNSGNSVQIQVISPLASVDIPNNMFRANELSGDNVTLEIGKADVSKLDKGVLNQIGDRPVIDLSLQSGDKKVSWNNPNAPVTVRMPYSPTDDEKQHLEHIVVWYLSGDGQPIPVPNGRYDEKTGTVVFTTTHFSKYAAAFVQKTFDDIASLDWAKNQIEVLASKGIINGSSDKSFDPDQPVTRADFLVLLVRTLELDRSRGMGDKFADVRAGEYYDEALRIARGMGITEGVGDNLFKPSEPITREDMIVMTERTLRVSKQITTNSKEEQLKQFKDYANVSAYAAPSIAALVEMGLVHGYDNAVHPKEFTNRAQAAVLMYNIFTNLFK